MTETAVDILAIAAGRLHKAYEHFDAVRCMQTSPTAAAAYEQALIQLTFAKDDVERARGLAIELAEAENKQTGNFW